MILLLCLVSTRRSGPSERSARCGAAYVSATGTIIGARQITRKTARAAAASAAPRSAMAMSFRATDFSSVVPYLVALKDIAIADLGAADAAAALAVFLVICLAPMIVPVALTYAAPQRAERSLGPLRRVLTRHSNKIIAVVCFVLAAYLAAKGIRGL